MPSHTYFLIKVCSTGSITRGIKKKEKWVARHKAITQKEALASVRNARRLGAYDKGRLLNACTADLIAKATH
jgi:hypothetical protein